MPPASAPTTSAVRTAPAAISICGAISERSPPIVVEVVSIRAPASTSIRVRASAARSPPPVVVVPAKAIVRPSSSAAPSAPNAISLPKRIEAPLAYRNPPAPPVEAAVTVLPASKVRTLSVAPMKSPNSDPPNRIVPPSSDMPDTSSTAPDLIVSASRTVPLIWPPCAPRAAFRLPATVAVPAPNRMTPPSTRAPVACGMPLVLTATGTDVPC